MLHGVPETPHGTLRDLLRRDPQERKTYVTDTPGKDVREAILHYETLQGEESLSLVRIRLETGRTHQIRAQFSAQQKTARAFASPSCSESENAVSYAFSGSGYTSPNVSTVTDFIRCAVFGLSRKSVRTAAMASTVSSPSIT